MDTTLKLSLEHQPCLDISSGPDYSFSCKSKALVITSVALFAIALVGLAATTVLFGTLGTVGLCMLAFTAVNGVIGGLAFAFGASACRTKEIASRDLAFANTCDNSDLQFQYYSKTAQTGNIDAIRWGYETGQHLILEAFSEIDENEKALKFKKGLRLFDSSAAFSAMGNNFLNSSKNENIINVRIAFTKELNEQKQETHSFKQATINYWSFLVINIYRDRVLMDQNRIKNGDYTHVNSSPILWKPAELL